MRATPNSSHSTRSAGNGVPGGKWPARIASTTRSRISTGTVRRSTRSNVTAVTASPQALEVRPLAGDIERFDDRLVLCLAPVLGGDEPHDLELEAVGVAGVEALVGAVIAGADERAGRAEAIAHLLELLERGDLPGEVVHADRSSPGFAVAGARTDGEEGDVVVVVGGGSAHEHERDQRGRR